MPPYNEMATLCLTEFCFSVLHLLIMILGGTVLTLYMHQNYMLLSISVTFSLSDLLLFFMLMW